MKVWLNKTYSAFSFKIFGLKDYVRARQFVQKIFKFWKNNGKQEILVSLKSANENNIYNFIDDIY